MQCVVCNKAREDIADRIDWTHPTTKKSICFCTEHVKDFDSIKENIDKIADEAYKAKVFTKAVKDDLVIKAKTKEFQETEVAPSG